MKQRVALICLDGLSADQFGLSLLFMPKLAAILGKFHLAELNPLPFCDPQPIWAELLTGESWYRNGCTGYAVPKQSLSELKICTERDLLTPVRFLPEPEKGRQHVVINVPLLEPLKNQRVWFANASSPAVMNVSPSSITETAPYSMYKPRPVSSMGAAMSNTSESLTKFITAETNKLECATSACNDFNWQHFIYRASIFDQLAHLLGPQFLMEKKLKVWPALLTFLTNLDATICEVIRQSDQYLIFSGFSHGVCKAVFSLNDLFENAKLLSRTEPGRAESQLRLQASAAARPGSDPSLRPLVSEFTKVLCDQTICASPTRGVIYINSKDRFVDGTVSSDNLAHQVDNTLALLNNHLSKFGGRASIHVNIPVLHGPQFVVAIENVELVESLEHFRNDGTLPHSTHLANGFVYFSKGQVRDCKPVDIRNIVGV